MVPPSAGRGQGTVRNRNHHERHRFAVPQEAVVITATVAGLGPAIGGAAYATTVISPKPVSAYACESRTSLSTALLDRLPAPCGHPSEQARLPLYY